MKSFGFVIAKMENGSVKEIIKVVISADNLHTWTNKLANGSIWPTKESAGEFIYNFVPAQSDVEIKEIRII